MCKKNKQNVKHDAEQTQNNHKEMKMDQRQKTT